MMKLVPNRQFFTRLTLVLVCFASTSISGVLSAQDATRGVPPVERIFWDKAPLRVTLHVNQERIVSFPKPGPIQVGMPRRITDKTVMRTQIVGNTVYFLPLKSFAAERVQIIDQSTGETFLFDLEAVESELGLAPIEIVSVAREQAKAAQEQGRATEPDPTQFDYVTLTRFASQQLYAPSRLLENVPGINRVPIQTEEPVALVRGGKVEAFPLIAWKGGPYYVSAIRLQNKSSDYITLDPRALRGQWLTATFQHARLFPHGDITDTTTVYLVSQRPFENSMY